MSVIERLTSRIGLITSVIAIIGAGLVLWWLDGVRDVFFRAAVAAYIVAAMSYVTRLTPKLVAQLRPVVQAPDETFSDLAGHVIGARVNLLLQLFPPIFALGWLTSLLIRLTQGAEVGLRWHFSLTESLMPIVEVIFSVVMVWRMVNLARLSSQTLAVNLFDPRGLYPFGNLSFAYASVISIRMLMQILLFGDVQGVMRAIFTLAAGASLLALILPIWSVHTQMVRAKIEVLLKLDGELNTLTQHLFKGSRNTEDISHSASQVMAIGAMRDRIAARSTWPVPDSVTAIQAVALSASPTLLSAAKSYVLPALGLG